MASSGLATDGTTPAATITFAQLPGSSALPANFPARLVPSGATLINTASFGGKDYAIFASGSSVSSLTQAYEAALSGFAQEITVTPSGPSDTIDFSLGGRPGFIALSATAGGSSVSVEVAP